MVLVIFLRTSSGETFIPAEIDSGEDSEASSSEETRSPEKMARVSQGTLEVFSLYKSVGVVQTIAIPNLTLLNGFLLWIELFIQTVQAETIAFEVPLLLNFRKNMKDTVVDLDPRTLIRGKLPRGNHRARGFGWPKMCPYEPYLELLKGQITDGKSTNVFIWRRRAFTKATLQAQNSLLMLADTYRDFYMPGASTTLDVMGSSTKYS
ncbi:hypothetical protein STEG23_014232 [Scotinomys teguina]